MGIICTLKRLACHIAAVATQVQRANVALSYARDESSWEAEQLPPALIDRDDRSLGKHNLACYLLPLNVVWHYTSHKQKNLNQLLHNEQDWQYQSIWANVFINLGLIID